MTERERRRRIIDHLREGKTQDAADELAGSREPYPGDGVLHHAIGLAFASRGTLGGAREQLEAAVKLSPDSPEILADLAQVCLAQGEAQQAIETAEQALAVQPDLAIARFTLGRACFAAECARQARHPTARDPVCHFPLIDGRAPLYLRALREMEAALDASPPFMHPVRAALAFAYLRSGHYHAAAEQLQAQLTELPSGEELDRVRARLRHVEYDITRESYWAIDKFGLSELQEAAQAADASPEIKLRLSHAYTVMGDEQAAARALPQALEAGYEPHAAHISRAKGEDRLFHQVSDAHLLIAGGLECIVAGELRFLPFSAIQSVELGPPAPWRTAEVLLMSGEPLEAVVPSLYRLSLQSANDLIQSGRFTQFSYAPGERRYAHAIGVRNLATESGVVPFAEIQSITFQ